MNSLFKDTLRYFRDWIAYKRAYQDNVGLSISIFNKDQILFQEGFGYAHIENKIKATPETIYRVASISKIFTATAIMQLVEKGKLNLHEKVTTILPHMKLASEFDYKDATIWNLLTHTSGLPRESNQPYWNTLKFPSKNEVIEGLKLQKQAIPKSTISKYSNLAFGMLGEIIAVVSGVSYEEYIEKNIFERLGLKSSFIRNMNPQNKNFAIGYNRKLPGRNRDSTPFVETNYIAAAANLCSTVQDLTTFLQSFMAKKEILLQPKTINDVLRCQLVGESWVDGFGLGFSLARYENMTLVGHNGGFNGFISHAYYLKEKNLGMVALTNSTDSDPTTMVRYGYDLLLPTLNHIDQEKYDHSPLEKYSGKFRGAFRDIYVQPFQGELYQFAQTEARPFQLKAKIKKIAENEFILDTTLPALSIGEPVKFEFNNKNEVTRMYIGSMYFDKINDWLD